MKNFYEYDQDRSLPYGWDHPAGVPKDYDELYVMYGKFIVDTLRRHNKVDRNATDLLQGIWERLLQARLLEKFSEGAARRLPLTMQGADVAKFLGLRWEQWQHFLRTHEHGQCIEPREGDRTEILAVWETADICDVSYEDTDKGYFRRKKKEKGGIPRKRPATSNYGFKTYLQKAVHNAFANLCRTKSRRHKEHVLTPDTVLSVQSDGCFRQSSGVDGFSSWEANIAAAMTDEEGLLDLILCFRKLNIDLNGPEGTEILDHMVQQGKKENGPDHNIKLLGFLGQGYTLSEALRRVQVKGQVKVRQ